MIVKRLCTRIDELRGSSLQSAYTVRGAATLRVKLLIRRAKWKEASDLAKTELAEFSKVNDSGSTVALKMSRALALVCSGDRKAVHETFSKRGVLEPPRFKNTKQTTFKPVESFSIRLDTPTSHHSLKERSLRIWSAQANKHGPMDARATEKITASVSPSFTGYRNTESSRAVDDERTGVLVDRIVSGFRPRL